jgi:hypothetical protein
LSEALNKFCEEDLKRENGFHISVDYKTA